MEDIITKFPATAQGWYIVNNKENELTLTLILEHPKNISSCCIGEYNMYCLIGSPYSQNCVVGPLFLTKKLTMLCFLE